MKPFLVTLYKNTHRMMIQLSINAYSAEEALYRAEAEVRKHNPDFITVCCSYALKEAKEIFEEGYNTVYPSSKNGALPCLLRAAFKTQSGKH